MILIVCLSHASSTGSRSSRNTVEELICGGEQRRAEHRSLPSITTQQIHHADRTNTKYEAWTQIQVKIAKKYCKEKKSSVEPHPSNPTRGRQAGKPAWATKNKQRKSKNKTQRTCTKNAGWTVGNPTNKLWNDTFIKGLETMTRFVINYEESKKWKSSKTWD